MRAGTEVAISTDCVVLSRWGTERRETKTRTRLKSIKDTTKNSGPPRGPNVGDDVLGDHPNH